MAERIRDRTQFRLPTPGDHSPSRAARKIRDRAEKLASAVLANFSQVVKEGDVRIHPIVARMVDPELLKKTGAVGQAAHK